MRRPLTVGVPWNGAGDIETLLERSDAAEYVDEVLVSPSNESTWDAVCRLKTRFPKLRSLNAGDTGLYAAFNKLISNARTTFLCFHGVDDLLVPDRAVGSILASATGDKILVFSVQLCSSSGAPITVYHHREQDPPRQALGRFSSPATPEVAYPVAVLREIGGADTSFRIAGDADLYFRARKIAGRIDCENIFVEMRDGGMSTTARHALAVLKENRRISQDHGQGISLANRAATAAFLGGRHILYRFGGERFSALVVDGARLLLGRRPRYSQR